MKLICYSECGNNMCQHLTLVSGPRILPLISYFASYSCKIIKRGVDPESQLQPLAHVHVHVSKVVCANVVYSGVCYIQCCMYI